MRTNNDKGFSVAATISGRLDCKVTDDFRVAHISGERPSSGIAGWRGGSIADIESEGTRPALLPAGPVPER